MPMTPREAADNVVGRARSLLAASATPGLPGGSAADLRRLGLVMGVAALDTYMHALVHQRAYWNSPLPKGLAQLDVRFDDLVSLADSAVEARRRGVDGRPRVAAKNVLQKRLLRETFQKFDSVSDALAMAGASKVWAVVATQMTPATTPAAIKARLDRIVGRRNQIVHEGDLQRQSRPRHPRLNGLTRAEAEDDVDYIAEVVHAIDAVV